MDKITQTNLENLLSQDRELQNKAFFSMSVLQKRIVP